MSIFIYIIKEDELPKFKSESLREILKSRGLRGWSRLKKSDLISLIEENDKVKKENPFGRPDQAQAKILLSQREEHERDEENIRKQLRRQQMISENLIQKQRERHELQEWCNLRAQMIEEERKLIKDLIEAGFVVRYMGG